MDWETLNKCEEVSISYKNVKIENKIRVELNVRGALHGGTVENSKESVSVLIFICVLFTESSIDNVVS